MRTSQRVFVYGSLVEPSCLARVLGHRYAGERLAARLEGYQRFAATPAYPFPYIVAAAGEAVDGVLILEISPSDLDSLDRYEDVEDGVYRRETVEVEAWGCGSPRQRVQAFVYVAGPGLTRMHAEPSPPHDFDSAFSAA